MFLLTNHLFMYLFLNKYDLTHSNVKVNENNRLKLSLKSITYNRSTQLCSFITSIQIQTADAHQLIIFLPWEKIALGTNRPAKNVREIRPFLKHYKEY